MSTSSTGGNPPQQLLHGYFNSNHTSTLYAYWVNYPTPWPFLLFSVLLSVFLGYLGFRSSSKSWHPIRKKTDNGPQVSQSSNPTDGGAPGPAPTYFTNLRDKGMWTVMRERPLERMSYSERKQWHKERRERLNRDAELAARAQYAAEGVEFDPEHDVRMDGGLGKYALITTLGGVAWTTIRAATAFALAVKIICGSHDTFPNAITLFILFLSAHTYCASRAMPRIVYLFLALDLLMIYGALVLTLYGLVSDKDKYAKIGVAGGACPYYSSDPCSYNGYAPLSTGCTANLTATRISGTHDYPPNQDGTFTSSTDPSDPNHGSLHIWYLQFVVGLLGAIAGLLTLILCPGFINMAFYERKPFRPLPTFKMATWGRFSYTMAKFAFFVLVALAVIVIPIHLLDELRARELYYFDSSGPDSSVAGSKDISGGGWTDCFVVKTSVDKTGHLKDWWAVKESRVERVLAGV